MALMHECQYTLHLTLTSTLGPFYFSRILIIIFFYIFTDNLFEHKHIYAWLHIIEKPTYSALDGSWEDVTPDEMDHFIALIIFMGFVGRADISRYWSQATLYAGGWARRIMPRNR